MFFKVKYTRVVNTDSVFTVKRLYLSLLVTEIRFLSYEIELQNRVSQNDVTLRVANSKIFIEIFLSSYYLDLIKY